MSRRLAFLSGCLSGMAFGALLVLAISNYLAETSRPARHLVPRNAIVIPASYPAPPQRWERRYFNGQPYYIIPLRGKDATYRTL